MRDEFFINRQGKRFVLYAGLLDEAHGRGLKSIETELLQIPGPDNGEVAIVKAKAEMEDGSKFAGIGDASPDNVGSNIEPHIIRMAECVTTEAQILTADGWRRWDELEIDLPVLAYDVTTDTLRWVPLQGYTMFGPARVVRVHSRSFDVTCTPDHKWAVINNGKRRLKPLNELGGGDRIVLAAPEEAGGDGVLTPEEAAILGWLATDGHVRHDLSRASIRQSKQEYVGEIRELVATGASEYVGAPRMRHFEGYSSMCQPQHSFDLTADFTRELLGKCGFGSWLDLPRIVLDLGRDARSSMLDAMLKGDGSSRDGRRWVFGKKRKPGVMEAFEILATLEGRALGLPRVSSAGEVPIRSVRENRHAASGSLKVDKAGRKLVWCPQTPLGTWVMRDPSGTICITGNTRAKARALRDAINVGVTAFEELGGGSETGESGEQPRSGPRPVEDAGGERRTGELPATRKQLNYLETLVDDVVEDGIGRFEEMVGKPMGELTREEASDWIGRLSGRAS